MVMSRMRSNGHLEPAAPGLVTYDAYVARVAAALHAAGIPVDQYLIAGIFEVQSPLTDALNRDEYDLGTAMALVIKRRCAEEAPGQGLRDGARLQESTTSVADEFRLHQESPALLVGFPAGLNSTPCIVALGRAPIGVPSPQDEH